MTTQASEGGAPVAERAAKGTAKGNAKGTAKGTSKGSPGRTAVGRRASGTRTRVEVVDSAHGRELRVDGTFASFYRPGSAGTGSVWDALVAPLVALPGEPPPRVLLLGLGGGSAARLVRALAPASELVGVEIDGEVIRAAREAFGLRELGVELVHDDARRVLERERRRFDLVLDDVFVGRGDAVHKPPWLLHGGLQRAGALLRPRGILVSNTLDEWREVAGILAAGFEVGVSIEVEGYDNRILAARSGAPLSARDLRRAVAREAHLADALPHLRFRRLPGSGRAGRGRWRSGGRGARRT